MIRNVKLSSCYILVKPEFRWQIFEKYQNITFLLIPPNGIRAVPCERTHGQTEKQIYR